jgi:phospholipase/carboxylesterase
LLAHGTDDAMVPFASMAEAEAALTDAGVSVETLSCPGVGHGIDEEGLRHGGQFLQRVLSAQD